MRSLALRLARFGGPLAVLLLSLLFYWKLAFTDQYLWFDHPDMVNLELPRVQYQAWQVQHRHFPLWDPNIWCGQPLIGQTQPGPVYPLNLLFLFLPMQDGYLRTTCLNAYYVFLHLMAALGAYALARELRLGKRAAVLGACLFSFSGFLGTVPWLDVMNGGITTPLVALFFLRALSRRPWTNAALAGVCLGLAWLSGHHELPLLVSLTALAAWAVAGWRDRRLIAPAALFLVITGLVSAVQLWPTVEFGHLSRRWTGTEIPVAWNDRVPYRIHTIYSMPPGALAETLLPGLDTYGDTAPFAGCVAVALALLAVAAGWSRARTRWLTALTACAAIYTLGAFTPLHGFLYSLIPNLAKARLPVRAMHLYSFGLALLAACGLEIVLRREAEIWTRRARRALAVYGLFALAVLTAGILWHKAGEPRAWISAFSALITASALAAFAHQRIRAGLLTVIVFGVMLTELSGLSRLLITYSGEGSKDVKFAQNLRRFRDIGQFLARQPGSVRAVVNDTDVPVNLGDQEGFEATQGYVAGIPESHFRMEFHLPRIQQLLGVTHWVARQPERPDFEDVFTGRSGVKVFRVPGAMPRAWMVHQAEGVPGYDQLIPALGNPSLDFAKKAVLIGAAPRLATCAGEDRVRILRKGPDRVTLSVDAACRGLMVLGDSYFPGWKVRVDGHAGQVLPVYGMLRGVVVEGGSHTVDMIYRPLSILGGAGLSLAGLLTALLVAWLESRRNAQVPSTAPVPPEPES